MLKVQNSEIAQKFNQVADLLEIEGANPFRVRAYRNAARTILGLTENVSNTIYRHGDLTAYPGIGKDLNSKIAEIVETGKLSLLSEIEKKTPLVLRELLKIPGIGPKRVQLLYNKLGIKTLTDLEKIAEGSQLLQIKGFGEKTRASIVAGLKKLRNQPVKRLKLNQAAELAEILLQYLETCPLVKKVTVAGSFRRRQETIGDIDILSSGKNNEAIISYFLKFSEISEILSHGTTRSTVNLKSGVQVDLRVVPEVSYGAALLYFTGSKAHNVSLRTFAMKQGLKINEYGIFKDNKRLASRSENDIYRVLKLPYIEPELRENKGEIEAALSGKLPVLISQNDILGDLHAHTKATDGIEDIKTMALAAQQLGYSYLAITDHSKRLTVAHGLSEKQLLTQMEQIDEINEQLTGFTILKSCEVDILEDGSLDISNEVLAKLDFSVCAIHSRFQLSKEKQTQRILKAMENPHFRILAHPTGRLIGERPSYDVDLKKIILAASRLKRILEINCQPERMDLNDDYCRLAKDLKVKMAISTDAHSLTQLNYMKYGIGQARRGWLEKEDVINTLPLKKLRGLLR